MNARRIAGVRACGMAEARVRLAQAHEFVRVATLCMDEDDSEDMHAQAAAALAVLAGIAALRGGALGFNGERSVEAEVGRKTE